MLTMNLLSYKSENLFSDHRFEVHHRHLFSDHRSEGHHGHLLSYTEGLFSYHNSWPFAIAKLQNIFFHWHRLGFVVVEGLQVRIHAALQKWYNASNLHSKYVTGCMHDVICTGDAKSLNKSIPKILDTNGIILHYINKI